MSLLGPSMHALNQRHLSAARAERGSAAPPSGLPHLGAYARGMLAALEGLHGQVWGDSELGQIGAVGGCWGAAALEPSAARLPPPSPASHSSPPRLTCSEPPRLFPPHQGYVHHDVKPANFCVEEGHVMAAAGAVPPPAPRVFLIDFGWARGCPPDAWDGGRMCRPGSPPCSELGRLHQCPLVAHAASVAAACCSFSHRFDPARCGGPMEFVGTPDFASSATLTSVAPGPRDDLEALVRGAA